MANSSGHMSHHGAHGTEWTLVAPDELARLASLHPVATRRLPRVQGGRPRTASACQGGGVDRPLEEASVGQAHTIGLDIAKRVFQAHGADASGRVRPSFVKLPFALDRSFRGSLSPSEGLLRTC